ncbi:hypothetical protein ANCCAN_16566 [Ancylostoma caninum]|uniref:Uncharacterized protein n=1 Tax=Ancylostoma caninum TaxID=29170 RepID=A0A368FZ93_ANCCA|nr:hypothetical protein ANCCAN_16566 [Ancylostoma caninum]
MFCICIGLRYITRLRHLLIVNTVNPVEVVHTAVKEAPEKLVIRADCRMEFIVIYTAKLAMVSEWIPELGSNRCR